MRKYRPTATTFSYTAWGDNGIIPPNWKPPVDNEPAASPVGDHAETNQASPSISPNDAAPATDPGKTLTALIRRKPFRILELMVRNLRMRLGIERLNRRIEELEQELEGYRAERELVRPDLDELAYLRSKIEAIYLQEEFADDLQIYFTPERETLIEEIRIFLCDGSVEPCGPLAGYDKGTRSSR